MKNLWKKLVAGIFVFALVVTGMNLLSASENEVQAAEMETSVKYYTQSYSGEYVIEHKNANTAPVPRHEEGNENYRDWLFAGWFTDEDCSTALGETIDSGATYYAKYVPAEVLSVKAQVKVNTTKDTDSTDLRLVSTVDSLHYKQVGFEVYYNGATKPVMVKTTTVYKSIQAGKDGVDYEFSPNIFDIQSEYFITATLKNIANKNFEKGFYIRPYWETLDGTTVYGVSRYARVEDSYLNIVNVPVRVVSDATTATVGNISVAYPSGYFTYADTYGTASTPAYMNGEVFDSITVDGATSGTVTIIGTATEAQKVNGEVAHLRLKIKDGVILPKKNVFTVTSSDLTTGVVVKNSVYNYFRIASAYSSTLGPDTSWYDENETEFVITTAEELYGLAQKVNTDGVTFSGKTVYLGSNISINSGTPAGADGEGGTDDDWSGTIAPNNIWIAIGKFNSAVPFSGVFDGQEHTIKGMYAKGTKDTSTSSGNVRRVGLFSYIKDATVKNVKILDSYVYARYEGASIAGQAENSTISNVYSNARVYHYDYQGGGIVGVLSGGTIEQCWYAGDVSAANASAGYVGGMVGVSNSATNVLIQDCLVSGSVTATSKNVGGFVGAVLQNTTTISDCLNVGTVSGSSNVGTAVGNVTYATVSSVNYYGTLVTEEVYTYQLGETTYNPVGTKHANSTIQSVKGSSLSVTTAAKTFTDTATYSGYNASDSMAFDFDNTWVVRQSDTPVLKSWVTSGALYVPDTEWAGSGEKNDPYIIKTPQELYGLAKMVDEGTTYKGQFFKLGANITVNSGTASRWEDEAPKYNWEPIGEKTDRNDESVAYTKSFQGTFDGANHTVKGLYTPGGAISGMFVQAKGVTIKNLKLTNSFLRGNEGSGGLVGWYASGTFDTIYSDLIAVSETTAGVSLNHTGGFVTIVDGATTFNNCWFDGRVTGKQYVGSLVGYNTEEVTFTNCLNTGTTTSTVAKGTLNSSGQQINAYVGAFVGYADANVTIENSMQTMPSSGYGYAGTTVGRLNTGKTLSVENSYFWGQTNIVGAASGTIISDGATLTSNKNNPGNIYTDVSTISGANGYLNTYLTFDRHEAHLPTSEQHNGVWVARTGKVPGLKSFVDADDRLALVGENTYRADTRWYNNAEANATEYSISNAEELVGFASISTNDFTGKTIYLDADITLNAGKASDWYAGSNTKNLFIWSPMGCETTENNGAGGFKGCFDGDGHTISGAYCSKTTSGNGFFRQIAPGSTVQNFSLTNSCFSGKSGVAAICGWYAGGTLRNVHSDAYIKATDVHAGGLVMGSSANATIQDCSFAGEISGIRYIGGITGFVGKGAVDIESCSFTGKINGTRELGGIVGFAPSPVDITNCYSTGSITDSAPATANDGDPKLGTGGIVGYAQGVANLTECWFDGDVTGTQCIGGLVGRNNSTLTITDCLNTGTVASTITNTSTNSSTKTYSNVGGFIGRAAGNTIITNSINKMAATGFGYTGTTIGRLVSGTTCTVNNSYLLKASSNVIGGASGTVISDGVTLPTSTKGNPGNLITDLNTISGANGYLNTYLTFDRHEAHLPASEQHDGAWVARSGEVPGLKSFVDEDDRLALVGENAYRADTRWYDEEETEFTITTAEQLIGFASLVNGGQTFAGKTVTLGANIALNDGDSANWSKENNIENLYTWTPIGKTTGWTVYTNAFQGTFDGNSKTISGLYSPIPESVSGNYSAGGWFRGLFGWTYGATLRNFTIENSFIEAVYYAGTVGMSNVGTIDGVTIEDSVFVLVTNDNAAGVVGSTNGTTVQNCNSFANVEAKNAAGGIVGFIVNRGTITTSTTIQACTFSGTAKATKRAGGILGYAQQGSNNITNCYVTGTIEDNNAKYTDDTTKLKFGTGGIVGYAETTVTMSGCWFDGTVNGSQCLGGLIGRSDSTLSITDCLNTGTITSSVTTTTGSIYSNAGGFAGRLEGNTTITDSVNKTEATGLGYTGTTIGRLVSGITCTVNNSYLLKNKSNVNVIGGAAGTVISDDVTLPTSTITKGNPGHLITDISTLYDLGAFGEQKYTAAEKTNNWVARLDYDNWTARIDDVPIPSVLADKVQNAYTIDTSWYDDAEENATQYSIENVADFYGLALLSQTNDFSNKTITLADNMIFNTIDVTEENAKVYKWLPIGDMNCAFAGEFNGNGKTISGLYREWKAGEDLARLGLFDTIADTSNLHDFNIRNTYFGYTASTSDNTRVGSVAGGGSGTITNVSSDATLVSKGLGTGGIIGVITGDMTISNCWYSGKATADSSDRGTYLGGIAGYATAGTVRIERSHVNGSITSTGYRVGGIIGDIQGTANVTLDNCLFNGDIKGSDKLTGDVFRVGQLVGTLQATMAATPTLNIQASYGVNNFASYDVGALASYTHTDETVYTPTVTGSGKVSVKEDRLIGYAGNTAGLDYSGYWTLTKSGTPMLKKFVKADDIYDGNQLTSLFKLDTFGKTLANAEEVGAGRYTIKITGSTKAIYDQYCEALDTGIFDPYNNDQSSDLNGEGVYNKVYTSAACGDATNDDWCINATYLAASDANGTITITVSSAEVLSQHLKADSIVSYDAEDGYTTSGLTPTFHMIEQKFQDPAASYVIQLSNGHLIVIDGGVNLEAPYLMEYLESLVPEGKKPIIEAWVLSHAHMDHIDSFRGFVTDASKYQGKVYLEGIYFSEASDTVMSTYDDGHHHYTPYIHRIGSVFQTTKGKEPRIYRMYTGQRYTFDTVVMDVMLANEQFASSDYVRASQVTNPSVFNETSTWTMFTINGKKLLTAGDSNYIGKEFVVKNYSTNYLTVDIFTALHHGENINREQSISNDDFSKAITVKGAVLFSYPIHWDDEQEKTSITTRVNTFMFLQRYSKGMTGLVTTYESGSTGSKNPEDYFYHGQGTVVLTFGDSITAKVKAHNDWVNEYAPATTTTPEE